MKDIFIFGSGRSGTSMLAGLFSKAGYHMGESLYPPRDTNPKGFFESWEINSLNEEILKLNYGKKSILFRNHRYQYNKSLRQGQHWLANCLPGDIKTVNNEIIKKIQLQTQKSPFCFKDPRFSHTYPVWKEYTKDHVCLVIYRDPSKTIASIIREIRSQEYLSTYTVDEETLYDVWLNIYRSCLSYKDENFLFVHYDQLFEQKKLTEIANFTNCDSLFDFPDRRLDRSKSTTQVPSSCNDVYEELNAMSKYTDD